MLSHLRYAWRSLRGAPWYSAITVSVLAIGLALTTATFAIVDGVLFKPLPYRNAHELFLLRADISAAPRSQPSAVSWREIDAWMQAVPELTGTGIRSESSALHRVDGRDYWGAAIDEHFFDVLGVRPLLGGFTEDDFERHWSQPGQTASWQPVLISHALWRHMLAGDASAVGRTIAFSKRNETTYGIRVAGVLPQGFVFPLDVGDPEPDFLTPIVRSMRDPVARGEFRLIARVPPSLATADVRGRLLAATRRLAALSPPPDPHRPRGEQQMRIPFDDVRLVALTEHMGNQERRAFWLVFAGAGTLLLLACLNVAGLAAARNVERARDLAIRRSLGASFGALIRGVFAEVTILAVAATALAVIAARPTLQWTLDLLPRSLTLFKTAAIDFRVLAAAAVFGAVSLAVVAVWPAFVAARITLPTVLRRSTSTATRSSRRSSFVLVSTQVALGFVLLIAGGLTIASLAAAWHTDPGYRRDRMALLEVFAQDERLRTGAVQLQSLFESLRELPGVDAVAVSTIQPLFERRNRPYSNVVPRGWKGPLENVAARQVSRNFFDVMGLRLVDGRLPAVDEWDNSQTAAIVSQSAARILWPDRSAVGQVLVAQRPNPARPEASRTVMAVVADARYGALDRDPIGDIYLPDPIVAGRTGVFFHVRTTDAAARILPGLVQVVSARSFYISQAATHQDALFASVKHRALSAWLFGSLGLTAVLVMGMGVLGLLAVATTQRTREIGIRFALGATPARVVRLLVGEQLAAVATGLAAGGLVSLWTAKQIEAQLFGVRTYEPAIWLAVALTIVAVAILGTIIPSGRAARVDPVVALRAE